MESQKIKYYFKMNDSTERMLRSFLERGEVWEMEREREKNNTKPQIVFSDPTGPSSETPIPLFLFYTEYWFVIQSEQNLAEKNAERTLR